MAPHVPSPGKRPFAGQVVRPPNPGDGVGRALRQVYRQDAALPTNWRDYLQSLDDLPEQ
jgi:hypothetical protein